MLVKHLIDALMRYLKFFKLLTALYCSNISRGMYLEHSVIEVAGSHPFMAWWILQVLVHRYLWIEIVSTLLCLSFCDWFVQILLHRFWVFICSLSRSPETLLVLLYNWAFPQTFRHISLQSRFLKSLLYRFHWLLIISKFQHLHILLYSCVVFLHSDLLLSWKL